MAEPRETPAELLAEAGRYLKEDHPTEAIRLCRRVLRMMPDSFPAHLRLGEAYRVAAELGTEDRGRTGHLEMAVAELGEAIRVVPPDEFAHRSLIGLAVTLEQRERLANAYRSSLSSLPFADRCLAELAQAAAVPEREFSSWRTFRRKLRWAGLATAALILFYAAPPVIRWAFSRVGNVVGAERMEAAPAFALEDLHGGTYSSATHLGQRPVVLGFWNLSCTLVCDPLDAHRALAGQLGRTADVLSIAVRDSRYDVGPYIDLLQWKATLVLLDRDGAAAYKYGASSLPAFMVVDRQGFVRGRWTTFVPGTTAGEVLKLVNQLILGEAPAAGN